MFHNSSCSNEPSNSFNSLKSKSFSINSTKLKGGLQSILGSLGQLLFTNINLFYKKNCKLHLFKIVSIHVQKKSFQFQFVTQESLGFSKSKTQCRKHGFMFCPPLKRALDFLGINLVTFENQHFLFNKFCCQYTCVGGLLKNIQIRICIYYLICPTNFRFYHWVKIMITF